VTAASVQPGVTLAPLIACDVPVAVTRPAADHVFVGVAGVVGVVGVVGVLGIDPPPPQAASMMKDTAVSARTLRPWMDASVIECSRGNAKS